MIENPKATEIALYWQTILLTINGLQGITQEDVRNSLIRFIKSLNLELIKKAQAKISHNEGFIVDLNRPFDLNIQNSHGVFVNTYNALWLDNPNQIIAKLNTYMSVICYMPFVESFFLFRLLVQRVYEPSINDYASQTALAVSLANALKNKELNRYLEQVLWFYGAMLVKQTHTIRQN